MKIQVFREYKNHHTDGELFVINDTDLIKDLNDIPRFCYVLEDIGRPDGVKIPGETCIPEGKYNVVISRSTRWDKDMMLLVNQDDGSLIHNGIRFTGIRPHGGNSIKDTHGCPLLGFHTDLAGSIWKRASDDLFELVKAAIDRLEVVTWEIKS